MCYRMEPWQIEICFPPHFEYSQMGGWRIPFTLYPRPLRGINMVQTWILNRHYSNSIANDTYQRRRHLYFIEIDNRLNQIIMLTIYLPVVIFFPFFLFLFDPRHQPDCIIELCENEFMNT